MTKLRILRWERYLHHSVESHGSLNRQPELEAAGAAAGFEDWATGLGPRKTEIVGSWGRRGTTAQAAKGAKLC